MSESNEPRELDWEQRQRFLDKLNEVGSSGACPRCSSRLNMHNRIVDLPVRVVGTRDLIAPSEVIPAGVVICPTCGYLLFHALGVLGLLDLGAPEEAPQSVPEPGPAAG